MEKYKRSEKTERAEQSKKADNEQKQKARRGEKEWKKVSLLMCREERHNNQKQ